MRIPLGRPVRLLAIAAVALALSACAATPSPAAPSAAAPVEPAPVETPVASAEPTPDPAREGAAEAFLAWVEASRAPDVDRACGALSPELIERMIAELNEGGMLLVDNCPDMMVATADLYRAFDQDATVDIDVQSETETDAVLFVTYLASGDCGKIVMHRPGGDWILTERTQECGR